MTWKTPPGAKWLKIQEKRQVVENTRNAAK
jgi:hypothetical protein